jgi:hypothetical protein
MSITTNNDWHEANQRYLMAALGVVREELESFKASVQNHVEENNSGYSQSSVAKKKLNQTAEELPAPAALDTLTTMFGLSPFERNVLLMCAGMELDSSFARLAASVQSDPRQSHPNFSIALAALPGAHWSALAPNAPLRYWHLIEANTDQLLTKTPLRIDERILHYMTGVQHMDERLAGIVEPLFTEGDLVPSHGKLANRLAQAWLRVDKSDFPVIQLCGDELSGKRAIAGSVCSNLGLNLYSMSAYSIPSNTREIIELIRLWEREAALRASALFLDCNEIDTTDAARLHMITHFCETMRSTIIISSRKRSFTLQRPTIFFEINKPTSKEQHAIWEISLGKEADKFNGQLEAIVSQFNLSAQTIRTACSEVLRNLAMNGNEHQESSDNHGNLLWYACCAYTRPRLDDLAQRIEPWADWDDIVLPEPQIQILKEIAIHVRQRTKVYGEWGFAAMSSRGLGITALFTGESGTGKTMASEVLANELQLDLYRIDLSQVVNKYIGETEKNLKRIFDAAENGGAILLFDEADALFGKRSEVRDSHDRYANIEVSYLLQRMEGYRGLAILTTNMKSALDKAFLRRIRFIVQFPFPDAAQRSEIWRRIFPADTPTKGLDVGGLARLTVAGGNIRNIALNAAFLAANSGEPVRMEHIASAAHSEYAKLEKPLTDAEIGGWSCHQT